MTSETRRFAYTAIKPGGERVSDFIEAADARAALRRLGQDRLVVTQIEEAASVAAPRRFRRRDHISPTERILVLKQLAVMTRAGVDLLEALQTIAASLAPSTVASGLRTVVTSLRRGERVAEAFQQGLPGYPVHVYALIRSGEMTGQLDKVFREAAHQLTLEQRVAREIRNALIYPAFLLGAGTLAVLFLFLFVVPRFAIMLGEARADLTGVPKLVLSLGVAMHDNLGLWLPVAALLLLAAGAAVSSPSGRQKILSAASHVPGVRQLVSARQRAVWARVMGLALGAGVGLLPAAQLALASVPDGRFRQGLSNAFRALRAGRPVAEAFGEQAVLAPVDLSLIRAGQRASALPEMFETIATTYEEELADSLKRVAIATEQIAIAAVAMAIGIVVLSLVSALTAVYDSVG